MSSTNPLAAYRERLDNGLLHPDPNQARAVTELQRLYDDLVAAQPRRPALSRALARWSKKARGPECGVYLWGGVGRGKTLLMDMFFDCLPFRDKRRLHFHRFMGTAHKLLQQVRDHRDPLTLVAARLAQDTRIICFDELAVTDITDAMIIGNLIAALFERGVTLTATSNLAPQDLYRDGLQRARFVPAIELIERHTRIVHLDGPTDYRLRVLEKTDVYQTPLTDEAELRMEQYFDAIAPDAGVWNGHIDVLGRRVVCRKTADGVIWFDFGEICAGPRSQADYVELSRLYQTVLIWGVPRFDATLENEARRFIALVDEFYDRRVKLILTAAVPIHDLYGGTRLTHEFQRTASRLQEMQSREYLATEHRP